MATKRVQSVTYNDYIAALKSVVSVKSSDEFPRLIVLTGSSSFLQLKSCQAIISAWNKLGLSEAQSFECMDLQQADFLSLWSQASLFEPESLYVLRRAGNVRSLASWIGTIKSQEMMTSHIVLDLGDKVSAELGKQINRLKGVFVQCVEPATTLEFFKVTQALCKRAGIELEDDAIRLIVDSVGQDLGKIENEIARLSLQFAERTTPVSRSDISGSIGSLREDDVFQLFELLRTRKISAAHLLTEHFLERGESAIALTGIFSRYARDQVDRGGAKRGISGLRACAAADRRLKSSRMDQSLVISSIIDCLSED